jgi:hypothetical protein
MNLRDVPDDEVDDVRELLEQHEVPYFETPPSRFGISAGALWLRDDGSRDEAFALLDGYQRQRRERAREAMAAERQEGRAATFWTFLRHDPLRVIATLLAIVLLVALCALPYFLLRG